MAKDVMKKQLKRYAEEIYNKDENIKARAIDSLAEIGESAVPILVNHLKANAMFNDKRQICEV